MRLNVYRVLLRLCYSHQLPSGQIPFVFNHHCTLVFLSEFTYSHYNFLSSS